MGNCLGSAPADYNHTKRETEAIAMSEITMAHSDYSLAMSIQNGLHSSLSKSFGYMSASKSIDELCIERIDHKCSDESKLQIFTEYAPEIFSQLRTVFTVSNESYLQILTGENNAFLSFLSNSKSGRKQFFGN